MKSLYLPDINLWLALASVEHVHGQPARKWWRTSFGSVAFCRATQVGFLRLSTTSAAMAGKPLTMSQAWGIYDRFFEDDRVVFLAEPEDAESRFRANTSRDIASPKVWADEWILALASSSGGTLVTLDKALGKRGATCLLS